MLFDITHRTTYVYPSPVNLTPHLLRLRPRTTARQTLQTFTQSILPRPAGSSRVTELDGHEIAKLWFEEATDTLEIETRSRVETHLANPFDYVLEPWAVTLPIDYPASLDRQLQPYVHRQGFDDAIAAQLARELWQETEGNTVAFVGAVCQSIYQQCDYILRETGAPYPPGLTWQEKRGSCRDFVVLFAAVCRAAQLAARFVSGYEAGDPETTDHHLHAWAEVYLPGAGWRGYDPTLGLAVSDRHIALASSAYPSYAAPVTGGFRGHSQPARMTYSISVSELVNTEQAATQRQTQIALESTQSSI